MKKYMRFPHIYDFFANTRGVRRLLVKNSKEHMIHLGNEYPDKTFYVIRWLKGDDIGLMAIVVHVVGHIEYAIERGYIPVIDMKNYRNPYISRNDIGYFDVWSYFFEQPMGYSLDEIKRASNVILSDYNSFPIDFREKKYIEIASAYLRFSTEIRNRIETLYLSLFNNKKICGIKLRGTDYISTQPTSHAKQPSVYEAIEYIDKIIDRWGVYDGFYLATEDQTIFEAMKNHFGERLFGLEIDRLKSDDVWHKTGYFREDRLKAGEEYCLEIGLLAKCNSFIATECNGSIVALWLGADKYSYSEIMDFGRYV